MKQPRGRRFVMGVALMVSLIGNAWQLIGNRPYLNAHDVAEICQDAAVQRGVQTYLRAINNGIIETWEQERSMAALLIELSEGERRLVSRGIDLAGINKSQLVAWNALHNFMQEVRVAQESLIRVRQRSMTQADFYAELTGLASKSQEVARIVPALDGLVALKLHRELLFEFSQLVTDAARGGLFSERLASGESAESSLGSQVLRQLELIKRLRELLERQIANFAHAD